MEQIESKSNIESIAEVLIPLLLVGLFILGFYFIIFGSEKVVQKNKIKDSMSDVIQQGGDLRAVKQLYANRVIA